MFGEDNSGLEIQHHAQVVPTGDGNGAMQQHAQRKAAKKALQAQQQQQLPGQDEGCCENVGARAQALLDKVPPCTCKLLKNSFANIIMSLRRD